MPPKKKEAPAAGYQKGAARFCRVKNTLRMGCCGLPNVGKSSTFNLLCEQVVPAENFPFCTIDPSFSRCQVQDSRYDKLCDMWKSPSKVPAWLGVTDIAGLIKGASEGEGLGNAFLSHIQAVDGIFHVVRAFDNDEIVHVDDSIDPVRDLETIQTELCKKDLVWFETAMNMEDLAVKKSQGKMKLSPLFKETMEKVRTHLEGGVGLFGQEWTEGEVGMIRDKLPMLITPKPMVYLINMTQDKFMKKKSKYLPLIMKWVKEHGGGTMIPFSVEFEEMWRDLDEAGRTAFKAENPKVKSMLPKIIKSGYDELALQSFFTAGETEVRAWTVQAGSTAPQAAGVIHNDIEKGFVKAEIVGWPDFDELQDTPGLDKVKAAGKWRQEGKTYVMQDGDICHFQHNAAKKKK